MSDGTFITEWGEEGQSNGQFSMPEGLAVDTSSGKVYVSDTSNNNVQVFAPSESEIISTVNRFTRQNHVLSSRYNHLKPAQMWRRGSWYRNSSAS